MPLSSIVHEVNLNSLTNYWLNHPANVGISEGYWYYYSSSVANNTVGQKIKAYRWGTALTTNETGDFFTMDGTIQIVSESLNRGRTFHGGGLVRVGAGTNVQTGLAEDDAFFFYHLGDLRASDNAGYWDYASVLNGSSQWDYFQYHQHLPNVYEDYYDGRQVHNSGFFINSADKRFGHIQPTAVSSMGVGYTNVLMRIHQPSQGGAHNSHTDVELASAANKDYIIGGTAVGSSNRFHGFYLTANGTQWDVFSRTFALAANSVTAEVNHGTFDLADPTFSTTTTTGNMYNFPFRASAGALSGSEVLVPVIYNGAGGTFDLKVWKFTSADSIATNTITTQSIVTGLTQRPDCQLTFANNSVYALISDITNGGADCYKQSGSTWTNLGEVVTNGTNDIIRVHGFDFNTADNKFYTLLSGDITGSGTYTGPGMYSFSEGLAFAGYKHLAYTGSYGFQLKNALGTGYISYNNLDGGLNAKSGSEPASISDDERILIYQEASPSFFDKVDTKLGGDERIFGGIQLSDNRIAVIGNLDANEGSRGGYDLFLGLYENSFTNDPEFFATGGDKDDYFTGIIEDINNKKLWMVGYTKSYLAEKRDVKIHGFGRGIYDGDNKIEWLDLAVDSNGNQYVAGNHLNNSSSLVAKYDYNFDLLWINEYSSSALTTVTDKAYGITIDSNQNVYVVGQTNGGGAGSFDSYVSKFDTSGSLQWSKYFGTAGSEYGSSIATVTKTSTEYVVASIVSGSNTIINVLNTNGLIIEQNRLNGYIVNRLRKSDTEDGYFLLAGKDTSSPTKAQFSKAQILSSGDMIKWTMTYVSGSVNMEAFDIRNTEQATGAGGLGSQTGPAYHVVGTKGTESWIMKMIVDESAGAFQSTRKWATTIVSSSLRALTNTDYATTPSESRFTYAVGFSSSSLEGQGGDEGIITSFDYSGTKRWVNTLGHTLDEKLFAVERDVTNDNIISAGWSESHSNGRRGFIFRNEINGFGTGNYHEIDSAGMAIWYYSSSLATSTDNGTLASITAATNVAGGLTATSASFFSTDRTLSYTKEFYDGGNLWDFFLCEVSLNEIAAYKNTDAHKALDLDCSTIIEYNDDLFHFYQWGTAGDGTADDGNCFGYDLVMMSGDTEVFAVGQTSGEMFKRNTGASGVYDYLNIVFNINTHEFELYQNGTEFDEEVYNVTRLNDGSGSLAFVGRTAGTLGGNPLPVGGYDLFLGIYNPITEVTTYFSTGSGQSDRGLNVHDIGGNQLIVTFESQQSITTGTTNQGGFDVGCIKFNYSSSVWGQEYRFGSVQDEILSQEGKISHYMTGSNRVAIVGKTLGTISDDNIIYGNNDMFLGIIDLTSGSVTKYQIGTAANDTPNVVFPIGGDKLIIGGFTDASFGEPNDALLVTFDAAINIKGKSII